VPRDGDAFTILTAGLVSGSFLDGATTGLNLPSGVTFDVLYNPTNVMLLFNVDYAADFDMDGDVDGDDLVLWQASFGVNAGGDADNDGDTDGDDFLIWQQQLGSGAPAHTTQVAVPEPVSLLVALLCGPLTCATRKRR
jgi:hypothetical protein